MLQVPSDSSKLKPPCPDAAAKPTEQHAVYAQSLAAGVTQTVAIFTRTDVLVVQRGARYVSTSWLLVRNPRSREIRRLSLSLGASAEMAGRDTFVAAANYPRKAMCARRPNVPAQRLLPHKPLSSRSPPSRLGTRAARAPSAPTCTLSFGLSSKPASRGPRTL